MKAGDKPTFRCGVAGKSKAYLAASGPVDSMKGQNGYTA